LAQLIRATAYFTGIHCVELNTNHVRPSSTHARLQLLLLLGKCEIVSCSRVDAR
jgi:hypothetical protein